MPAHTSISSQKKVTSATSAKDVTPHHEPKKQDIYKEIFQRLPVQRKLSIGAVDDPLEDEADAIADKVMRMPEQNFIQRKCAYCEEEKVQRKPLVSFIQKKEAGSNNNVASDTISSQIQSTKGSGNPLQGTTKSFMESRFGADFSNINIHTGNYASRLSKELNAQAFTVGNDIYFNEGKYQPESFAGKHLLAHEITHTIQQEKFNIQKKDDDKDAVDSETEMGKTIIASAPDGLKLGFYDHNEAEMLRKASEWAISENAVGFKGIKAPVKVKDLVFGKPITDENKAGQVINEISAIAKTCVEKAAKATGITVGEQYKIKALAFFAHGTEGWCSITPISGSAGKKLVKDVAGTLKNDVDIIIYACSVANSPLAVHDDWDKGTLDAGGKDSMAAGVRDELFDQNIKAGKVWGHTTVGHVTTNFAIRYFDSSAKDTEGKSYVSEYVFTPYNEFLIRQDVIKQLTDDNYDTTIIDIPELTTYQFKNLRKHFYKCYAEANAKATYMGRNLAEAAPNHPVEVAKVINEYWNTTYWPKIKSAYISDIVKHFKLIKKSK